MNISREIFHWKFWINYLVVFLLIIFLSFISYWLILSSNISEYKKVLREEVDLKKEFEEKYQSSDLEKYRKQLASITREYESKKSHLAQESELSSLLNKITQIGMDSGIVLEFFAPRQSNKNNFINGLIIYIVVVGNYSKLMFFLSEILELNKLITFDDFEIYNDNIEQEKSHSILKVKIKAVIHQTNKQ